MQEKECKHETSIAHLKSEILSLHDRLEQAVLKLQDYPSTKEGKQKFEELWVNRMVDFKRSMELQRLLINSALNYYCHGYRICISQFANVGYPSLTAPTNFLDIHAGLADAPELDEEIPCELPENLLHVPREGKAPANLKEPMVEDVVPLKVVP
ncbi:UNVERIFIED_CONTAM: hypothetical protein Slati_4236700 [Sesamum latifolium]|uniref:Uncharacterized protein n=1 Tax=Sesamum latifolium TaxID=2727402 RepID=A0AAW2TBZ2_9LAMI